jgi:hypothetical protein|tara:strand:- start:5030 stop:5803 length:774 start_codon:yes stop_codon:yes gene_type:complete
MPYLPSEAKKKSELYDNVLSGDVLEYQNEIEDLKKSLNISGSVVDAKQPLRDSSGVLQSFESRVDGVSLEEDFQQVRLENKQQFFVGELDNSFSFFFDDSQQGEEVTDSDTTTEEQISTEQVEFQATVRDYLIQFVNEHFKEENTPDISTDRLHEKLTEFFKTEYDRYIGKAYGGTLMGLVTAKLNKGKNADGWEDFRLNKKREVRGISGKRFKEVKKDLRNFRYDEIVEDHLYRTLIGQEIWLKLGFPYIVDKKLD